jgi:hypothetical protein
MTVNACGPGQDQIMKIVVLKDGVSSHDEAFQVRNIQENDEADHDLQASTQQSPGESPMTINACGPSQDQIMKVVHQKDGDSSQVKQVPKAKLIIKKKIKKQSQGYNLGTSVCGGTEWTGKGSSMPIALETKRIQEDARTSARLRMLLGASRDAVSDSTSDDNPEDSKTLPGMLLE